MAARELASDSKNTDRDSFRSELTEAAALIRSARPTAVNLHWAVQRMMDLAATAADTAAVPDLLLAEAVEIQREDEVINRLMGEHGKKLMPDGGSVLTHCNTGALATSAFGTALGVIRAGWEDGKRFRVFNTENPSLAAGRTTNLVGVPEAGNPGDPAGGFRRRFPHAPGGNRLRHHRRRPHRSQRRYGQYDWHLQPGGLGPGKIAFPSTWRLPPALSTSTWPTATK